MKIMTRGMSIMTIHGATVIYSNYELTQHQIKLSKSYNRYSRNFSVVLDAIETIVLHSTYSYIKQDIR